MTIAALPLLAAVALAAPATETGAAPKVEPALQQTVKQFNEAFNRFEPEAVAAFWSDDGTVLTPVGTWGEGRAGVAKAYGEDAGTILKGSTSTFTVRKARHVGKDTVFLDLDQEIQGMHRPDGTTGDAKLHVAILAAKKGGKWQWLDARPYAFLHRPEGPPPAAK